MIKLFKTRKNIDLDSSGDLILNDIVMSARVKEAMNVLFTAEVEILKDVTGKWEEIKQDNIMTLYTPKGLQPFTIVDISDNLYSITLFCRHSFFDLEKCIIYDTYIQGKSGQGAITQIENNIEDKPFNFRFYSDIATINNLRLVRMYGVSALIGNEDNTFLNRFGGELEVDKFNVHMHSKRGTDRGYEIRWAKNITGFKCNSNLDSLVTRAIPMGFDGIMLSSPIKYIESPLVSNYDRYFYKVIKFEDVKLKSDPNYPEEEGFNTQAEVDIELTRRINDLYVKGLDKLSITIDVSFVHLKDTEEYKNNPLSVLETLYMGDTVNVILEPYNIQYKARMVEYEYDGLNNTYINCILGDAEGNYFSDSGAQDGSGESGNDSNGSLVGYPNKFDTLWQNMINEMTNMINTGIVDSYTYYKPNEFIVGDAKQLENCRNVIRINKNGLAMSQDGYNGTYKTGITIDGKFVITEQTALKINAALLEAGTVTTDHLSVQAKKDLRDGLVTETTFNVALGSINSTIKESNSNNIIRNSIARIGQKYWSAGKHHGSGTVENNVYDSIDNTRDGLQFLIKNSIGTKGGLLSHSIPVRENTAYTLTGLIDTHRGYDNVWIEIMCWDQPIDYYNLDPNLGKLFIGFLEFKKETSLTFTVPLGTKFINVYLYGEYLHQSTEYNYAHYWIRWLRLNEGNIPQPWSESNTFNESSQQQLSNEISSKVSSHDFTNLNSQFTEYRQSTEDFKWNIGRGLGENLVRNSGFRKGDLDWWWTHDYSPSGQTKDIFVEGDWNPWILDSTKACVIKGTNITTGSEYGVRQNIKVKQNTEYTLSYLCAHHRCNNIGFIIRNKDSSWLTSGSFTGNEIGEGGKNPSRWSRITRTFNTGTNNEIGLQFHISSSGDQGYYWITDICMNEGKIVNAWHPNSEEAYGTQMKFDTKGLRVDFANGSHSTLSPEGNKFHDGSESKDYHALSETGYTVVGGYNDVIPDEVWIQLPNIFRGKQFSVAISLQETMGGHQDAEWVQKIKMEVLQVDYSSARFLVKGDWWSRTTANDIFRKEIGIRWIAIA